MAELYAITASNPQAYAHYEATIRNPVDRGIIRRVSVRRQALWDKVAFWKWTPGAVSWHQDKLRLATLRATSVLCFTSCLLASMPSLRP